ncbi:MAG: polysaccharide biosynthesis tyrosine autokinase [Pseudomonadota bacterium]
MRSLMKDVRHTSGDDWSGGAPFDRPAPGFVDLAELFRIFLRDKWLILLCMVLTTSLGVWYGLSATPLYEARASLVLDPRERGALSGDEVVSQLPVSDAVVASEIAALRSNELIAKTIDQTGLAAVPEFREDLVTPTGLRAIMRQGRVALGLAPAALPEAPTRTHLIEEIRKRLSVSQDGISYVIEVSFYAEDPALAARFANAHVAAYVAAQQRFRREATANATAWLEERVASLQARAEDAEAAAVERRLQNLSRDLVVGEVVTQQLADLSSALSEAEAERVAIKARFDQVSALVEGSDPLTAAGALVGQIPERLLAERDRLRQEIASLAAQFGPGNATLIAQREALGEVEAALERQVINLVASLEGDLEVARSREQSLEESVRRLEALNLAQTEATVEIGRLEREAEAARELHAQLLIRLNETRAQQAFATADARIVSSALIPDGPYAPRKTIIALAAAFAGLMAGVGLAALRHLLTTGVRRQADLARSTGAPILATVPKLSRRGLKASTLEEWLRSEGKTASDHLSTLYHLLIDPAPPVCQTFAVVSASSREGKTTAALLLALTSAQSGKRTLLLETDLRKPSFLSEVLAPDQVCFADVAAGRGSAVDGLLSLPEAGFDILPSTRAVVGGSTVLTVDTLERVLGDLRDRYDVIIFDTAPILLASETLAVSRSVSAALFVARVGRTQVPLMNRSIGLLKASGCNLAGVILNEAEAEDLILSDNYYGYGQMPRRILVR